ncbi:MAG: metallophosphoesterase [Phycisphaerales bacterium]
MKLHILSDLHLEHGQFSLLPAEADVLILAGDISTGTRGLDQFAHVRERYREVVYVAGNHEYYKHALPRLDGKLRRRAGELGIRFLQDESLVVGGIRILGCTLWTDFELGEPAVSRAASVAAAESMMMDYRMIRTGPNFRRLRTSDTAGAHARSIRWLRTELGQARGEPVVVVTHHAPLAQSIGPQHQGSDLNGAFASDLSSIFTEYEIRLWIHGHTHHCVDYMFEGTRVVSNQRGYPGEDTGAFDPGLVAEVAVVR